MTDAAASSFAASHFTQFNTKAKLPNLTSLAHYIDLLESIMAKSGLRACSLVTRIHICTEIGVKVEFYSISILKQLSNYSIYRGDFDAARTAIVIEYRVSVFVFIYYAFLGI